MKMEDKDKFLEVMKGVPAGFIATAILYSKCQGSGVNWRGCSKTDIFEGLFGRHSNTLEKLPSLEELKDSAIGLQKQAKISTAINKEANDKNFKRWQRYPQLKRETIEILKLGIEIVKFDSSYPHKNIAFIEEAGKLIKEWENN